MQSGARLYQKQIHKNTHLFVYIFYSPCCRRQCFVSRFVCALVHFVACKLYCVSCEIALLIYILYDTEIMMHTVKFMTRNKYALAHILIDRLSIDKLLVNAARLCNTLTFYYVQVDVFFSLWVVLLLQLHVTCLSINLLIELCVQCTHCTFLWNRVIFFAATVGCATCSLLAFDASFHFHNLKYRK